MSCRSCPACRNHRIDKKDNILTKMEWYEISLLLLCMDRQTLSTLVYYQGGWTTWTTKIMHISLKMEKEIPNQLRNENCRFVRLKEQLKRPIDEQWTTLNNFKWDSEEIQEHKKNNNIGFLCGSDNIYVIDIDDKSLLNEFLEIIGKDHFIIETPNGFHIYIRYTKELKKIILEK